jgi:hypothetical protein
MERFVVRVWLPDRPGALGQVASRIGAVGGDVEGIDILERGAGRAIDELVVAIADASRLPLLVAEVGQVDGVDVEEVRPLAGEHPDAAVALLELAARAAEAPAGEVLTVVARDLGRHLEADWVVLLDLAPVRTVLAIGDAPTAAWLAAFVEGASHLPAGTDAAPSDVAWARLPAHRAALALGRKGRPFRARERAQVAQLGRLADALAATTPRVVTPAAS